MNYLIWDFDGTLGYREGKWEGALLEVLRRHVPETEVRQEQIWPHLQTGFPWLTPEAPHTEIRTAEEWWDRLDTVFARAFVMAGIVDGTAYALAKHVRHVYPDPVAWRLFDDAIPTLECLATQGWRHLLLSNHIPELPAILRHLGLTPHFAAVFNSAQTGYEKPHPQAFREVLQTLNGANKVWMVGDSMSNDIAGAAAVGIPGILVRKSRPEAQFCCPTLEQVAEIVSEQTRETV
ncbi:MAG: HAD family hydrolase [Armatimonadota bacterium]